MGKIRSEPEKETHIPTTHFSHPHPLNKLIITDHHRTLTHSSSSCSGCNLKPSGIIYSCTTCNFFLHKKCFDMPKKITHPFHKDHALALLPEPAYPDGLYRCDACGDAGKGFSYHCKPCGVDLHILCAATPLSISHASHAHKLELAFQPPYPTKDFSCDICKNPGADHWLYRCNPCGFDAHLSCVRTTGAPPPVPVGHLCQAPLPPFGAGYSRSVPVPPPQGFGAPLATHQNFMGRPMMNNPAVGVPIFGVRRQNDEAVLQAIQQRVSNNQALTQAIMAGNGGGFGGGGGDRLELQQMMQMMSSFNNNNSGTGGGGVPGFNVFGGGGRGGGGQGMLQSLFSGGGGGGSGGVDSLQSLLGGDNGLDFLGGGGGLDFLGALGG